MALTFNQKKDALTNALDSFGIPEKYFIQNCDGRLGHKFALATNTENGCVSIHSNYMTYEEFNAFLMGYNIAINKPFL